jgi:uncharacterized protein (DUF2141 family)
LVLYILLSIIFSPLYSQENSDLEIKIEGLRNTQGKLSITLFNNEKGFPDNADKAFKLQTIDLSKDPPVFIFKRLPGGDYAYAILHDEDNNNEMNKNMLGIPREGFGFSNNYRPRIKNPSFNDASFKIKPGKNSHNIEMVYYF